MNWESLVKPWEDQNTLTDFDVEARIRVWRNAELLASDWTQLPDIETNKVDVAAWKAYRQQLRDMLDAGTPVKDIVFPVKPT